ncbi:unnamed protein product [Moneuplotes crassus]|uniref:Uncharacterized protein n=1 Tax=Euplotes crassus TaxID=5936 RepID=A0AAD2DB53_EUPCR|nr:unnamed protein product [Moneuplotes crassus]
MSSSRILRIVYSNRIYFLTHILCKAICSFDSKKDITNCHMTGKRKTCSHVRNNHKDHQNNRSSIFRADGRRVKE